MAISILIIYFVISTPSVSTVDSNRTASVDIVTTTTSSSNLKNAISHVNTTNTTSSDPEDGIKLDVPTLAEFCVLLELNETNCYCENNELHEKYPNIVPVLCRSVEPLRGNENTSFPTERIILASVTTVSMIFGVTGNVFVLAVSYKNRKELPYTKILISQLAFVDAFFSINNFISEVHLFWSDKWILGLEMCKLVSGTNTLSSLLSIGYILIIAAERYYGILYTLRRSSKQIVYGCVIVNLVVAIGVIVPLVNSSALDELGVCSEAIHADRKTEIYYNWFLIIFYIFLPLFVISAIYIRIIRYLVMQAKSNAAINREDIRRKRNKSNHRIMKILLSIMIAFVTCVLPIRVCKLYLVYVRGSNINFDALKVSRFIGKITYSMHVCVNPVVYTAIDKECRNEMLTMMRLRRRLDSTTSSYQTTSRKRRPTQFTEI